MASFVHAVRSGRVGARPSSLSVTLRDGPTRVSGKDRSGSLSSQSPILGAGSRGRIQLGPLLVFAIVIVAYTAQSELASWVTESGWRKPYSMMYITHSSLSLLFPMTIALYWLLPDRPRKAPLDLHLKQLRLSLLSLQETLSSSDGKTLKYTEDELSYTFVLSLAAKLVVFLTLPSLSWFLAVPLTRMPDITAIYNTNAFFAYLLAVLLGVPGEVWSLKRLATVLAACLGVMIVVYGDIGKSPDRTSSQPSAGSVVIGDLLAALGSIGIGFYEVFYKLKAIPPADAPCLIAKDNETTGLAQPMQSGPSQPWADDLDDNGGEDGDEDEVDKLNASRVMYGPASTRGRSVSTIASFVSDPDPSRGLDHSSILMFSAFLTSLIGVLTFVTLWIPIPLIHLAGWEEVGLPESSKVRAALYLSAFCGVVFNGGLMVLISLWGPVLASVSNLITIVTVALVDWLLFGHPLSLAFLIGSGMIVAAFIALALEMRAD